MSKTSDRDEIIAQILEIMARHNLTPADIEEPENQQEPDSVVDKQR